MASHLTRKFLIFLCALGVGLCVAACHSTLLNSFRSVDPAARDMSRTTANMVENRLRPAETLTGSASLTLEHCRALALSRNLDLLAAGVDEITNEELRRGQSKKLLPHLVLAGELSQRDNYGYAFSDVIGQEGRTPSPQIPSPASQGVNNYSVGHERTTWRYTLELNWSPTDAAMAYFLAQNSRNELLRSNCQKTRVAQKLVGTVEAAFFRLLSLQKRHDAARELAGVRGRALERMKRLTRERLKTPEDENRARQKHVAATRLLLAVEEDLAKQRNILASAMAVSPDRVGGEGFIAQGVLRKPEFSEPIPVMETQAMSNRPEAREAGLNCETAANQAKRTTIKLFPRIAGFWRGTRDKDRFLYNKDWKDVGVNMYFDVGDWLANWNEANAARSNTSKMEITAAAVTVGIASQVRAAAAGYERALKELDCVESALEGSRKALRAARAKALNDDLTRLALLEAEADALEQEVDAAKALGEANAAYAELASAIGANYVGKN